MALEAPLLLPRLARSPLLLVSALRVVMPSRVRGPCRLAVRLARLLLDFPAAADPLVLCALPVRGLTDLLWLGLLLVIPAAADRLALCALPAPWSADLLAL